MKLIEIIDKINEKYIANYYRETIYYIEKYLAKENSGIYDQLLHKYILCQIKLGLFDEAVKNTEVMNALFPDFYNKFQLAWNYASTGQSDKLDKLLNEYQFSNEEYFKIGRACFLNGLLEQAEKLFNQSISDDEVLNERVNLYIRKLELYRNRPCTFVKEQYSHFKAMGKEVMPGHIIHARKIRSEYNENVDRLDSKSNSRPYMVWKIVDGIVYTFPVFMVSEDKDSCSHVLSRQDYPEFDYDKKIGVGLTCVMEDDIDSISNKVGSSDFEIIIDEIYKQSLISSDSQINKQFFIRSILELLKPEINDVIEVYDVIQQKVQSYFVLKTDSGREEYKVIKVRREKDDDNLFELSDVKILKINMKTPIFSITKLNEQEKEHLLKQIPNNYKDENMLGAIVEYNAKKLEIILEQDDYYVCLDRTFDYFQNYISVEFIEKGVPLFIKERVSNEEYNKQLHDFHSYMRENGIQYARKKHKKKRK